MIPSFAVVAADDRSRTPILTSAEGHRAVYLFSHKALADDFGRNQRRIDDWAIIDIPQASLRQWIEDRRNKDSATHVARQLTELQSSMVTIDEYLLSLYIRHA